MSPLQTGPTLSFDKILSCEKILSCDMGECVLKGKTPFDSGGQGALFYVFVNGREHVMKLHIPKYSDNALKEHLSRLIRKKPSPSYAFAWPLSLVECLATYQALEIDKQTGEKRVVQKQGTVIGYIMELVPKEYCHLYDLSGENEPDEVTLLKICINICRAFRQLHECQYSYKDISFGNILVNPKTASVKIIDNDNVTLNGENVKSRGLVKGTPRYIAPEIIDGHLKVANLKADLHSLAVLLFEILFKNHPLHGKREDEINKVKPKDPDLYLYSSQQACFVFKDENDLDKYIVKDKHEGMKATWCLHPKALRDMFYKVFVDCLDSPNTRPSADDWTEVLIKTLSRYYEYSCACGNEDCLFYDDDVKDVFPCEVCGGAQANPRLASIKGGVLKNITVLYDKREVYSCYIDPSPLNIDKDIFAPIFISYVDKNGKLYLESCQNYTLECDGQIIQKGEKSPPITSKTKIKIGEVFCLIKGKNL